jgi:hypothetical protein
VHGIEPLDGRIDLREIHPVQKRKDSKVVVVMMDDGGVSPRKQGESAFRADDIHRLPQAIQNQHRLI